MSELTYYVLSIVLYLVIISVGIAIFSFYLYKISNNFDIKYINYYGFFASMDNSALIMLASAVLKEFTLLYCVASIRHFSEIYLYIFMICSFTFAFFSFRAKTFIKDFIISSIEYLIIYLLSLLSSFLVEVKYSSLIVYYIIILSVVLISCSFFFFIKNLSTIIVKDNNVRRNLFVK